MNGVRLARVAYNDASPEIGGDETHVFFELGDHLGSTSVVLDKATGELVERGTYQVYGATESDYRPDRWQEFREDYEVHGEGGGRPGWAPVLREAVSVAVSESVGECGSVGSAWAR